MPEFAPTTRRLAHAPSAESLQSIVAVLAADFGGSVRADGDALRLILGDLLAPNPNDLRIVIEIRPDGEGIQVSAAGAHAPWTRARCERIAAHRVNQIADVLDARLGGTSRPVTDSDRRPFSLVQSPADYGRAFAGSMVGICALMALVMTVTLIGSWLVIQGTLDQLGRRVDICERAGVVAIPSRIQLDGLGIDGILGASALLAMPIAFLLGALQSLAFVLSEMWWRASRLPVVMSCLSGIAGAMAFASQTPMGVGILIGLAIPIAGWLGYSLVWGRRSEHVAATPMTSRARRMAAGVLVAMIILTAFPWPRSGEAFTDQLALFRDRYLLTHRAGLAYAHLYYRVTLLSAEPTKQAFDGLGEPDSYDKQAPLALVTANASHVMALLRNMGFITVNAGDPGDVGFDLVVSDTPEPKAGVRQVAMQGNADPKAWRSAVSAASNASFRGRLLLEAVRSGWQSIYYLGALFGIALVMMPLSLLVAALYSRVDVKRAHATMIAVFIVTVGALAYFYSRQSEELQALAALRRADRHQLQAAVSSPHSSVRHEAVYRLFRSKERPDLQPLLAAASDGDMRVRLWAAGALGKTGDRKALGSLVGLAGDPELLVRYRAMEGLGLLLEDQKQAADPEVVRMLVSFMRDGSWYEGMYALNALRRIDPNRW